MSGRKRHLEGLEDVIIWLQRKLFSIQHAWQSLARNQFREVWLPINEEKARSFEILCEWLEKDGNCELYTLQELFAEMEELISGNASTYSKKLLQSNLKEKCWDHI